jgi:hypothetical protein
MVCLFREVGVCRARMLCIPLPNTPRCCALLEYTRGATSWRSAEDSDSRKYTGACTQSMSYIIQGERL